MKELMQEHIREQAVKTKSKHNIVEIIDSDIFFQLLKECGLIKNIDDETKDSLEKFICLDPQYQDLIMVRKVVKASEELLKNENIITQIIEWRDQHPSKESSDG